MAQPVNVSYSGTGAKPWRNLNNRAAPFALSIVITVTGTINYTLELTDSDYNGTVPGDPNTAVTAVATAASAGTTSATTSQVFTTTTAWRAWRINIASGAGSVAVDAVQAGY